MLRECNSEEANCQKCERPDSAENMVGCDKCDAWEHYGCAGVSDSIADTKRSWRCEKCQEDSFKEVNSKSRSSVYTSASSKKSRQAKLRLELLDQQNQLKMRKMEEEEKYLKERFEILMQLEEDDDSVSERSKVSTKSKQKRLEKWLEEDVMVTVATVESCGAPNMLEEGRAIQLVSNEPPSVFPASETQSVSRKLEKFDRQLNAASTPIPNNIAPAAASQILPSAAPRPSGLSRVEAHSMVDVEQGQLYNRPSVGIELAQSTNMHQYSLATSPGRATTSVTIPTMATIGVNELSTPHSEQLPQAAALRFANPITTQAMVGPPGRPLSTLPQEKWWSNAESAVKQPSAIPKTQFVPTSNSDPNPVYMKPHEAAINYQPMPTMTQLAARQIMPRDLPLFTGNPEDWPIFYSSYKNSSEVCGYSDAENLARLQRCLRGNALEAVRSRLLLPTSVPYIIDTLQMLYGRPEILINSLLRRVRSCPSPRADNLKSIVDYGLAVQNMIDHMIISEQLNQLNNPMLLNELVDKLPTSLKLQWGAYKQLQMDVNLSTFNYFISNLVSLAADLMVNSEAFHGTPKAGSNRFEKNKEKLFVHSQQPINDQEEHINVDDYQDHPPKTCIYCEVTGHQIASCESFKIQSIEARWKFVRQKNLCRTCLVPHRKWPCRSKKECYVQGCRSRHHPLLHGQDAPQSEPASTSVPFSTPSVEAHQNHHGGKPYTLFRYLPVKLFGNGKTVDIFAFLDEGSSTTMLEAGIADQLGIDGPSASLWLSWTGKISREEKNSKSICVSIAGSNSSKQYSMENVQTVDELNLPLQSFNYEELSARYPHMKGLPLQSYSNIIPRMIIGLEHVRMLTALKTREGGESGPVVVKTRLGWCAFGKESVGINPSGQLHYHSVTEKDSNQSLHDLMRSYFAVEESTVTKALASEEDKRALNILQCTTIKLNTHYTTGLLWKVDDPTFPDSLPMAKSRLAGLEKRLSRDPTLAAKVQEQIESYLYKNYAHKLTAEESEQTDPLRVWYLPLGVVVSPTKPGKIRLIWDAAAKAHGVSLNDLLLKGPDLLVPLVAVILRFRERNIAICGDICEMFHQISIRKEDKQFQRFLWRNPNGNIEIYVMDVATFGATCSPCTAQFIKNKNAESFEKTFPRAARAITKSHYVDDFLDSTDTVEEAVHLIDQVKLIHKEAGFDIRKFKSNSLEVLDAAGEPDAASEKSISSEKHAISDRVLGLVWNPTEDAFTFDASNLMTERIMNGRAIPTKRQVLQVVMKLFDPLGFVSHFTVHGKILMQEVWRSGTNWDEPINEHLLDMWYRWAEILPLLGEVKVPRCYFGTLSSKSLQDLQVHIFVDASETAYACVAYLRLSCTDGIRCAFVASKTKVAPLKPLSIPRMELQAAMIGARLMQTVCSSLTLPINKRFLWSDSATVLAWLRSDSRRYHQFIGFRVGEILSLTSVDEWRYVPSNLNVADKATKWAAGPSFDPQSRWYTGPAFLAKHDCNWPAEEERTAITSEELRPVFLHRHVLMEKLIDETRFSNWNRLVRTMAYVYRAVAIWRKRIIVAERAAPLRSIELQAAENAIFRQAQAGTYADELALLNNQGTIPKSSPLYALSPFLDDQGIVRMRSRLEAAPEANYSAKYPIILTKNHFTTTLLTDSFHRRFLHGNKFYISGLRGLIRKISRGCQVCKIKKAIPSPPMMAPLPRVRLTPYVRAFTYVGVDYFGPLEVKVGRSIVKRWAALFTCLTVRAVHLELTHSLSTKSCIMAFRRFVARRGAPREVYSDNGTNFVGANRQLS